MEKKELEKALKSLKKTLGEENVSLIADNLATIETYATALNNEIANRDNEIKDLQANKEILINANANLLQQVSATKEPEEPTFRGSTDTDKQKEEPKPIDLRMAFDKNGNFIV